MHGRVCVCVVRHCVLVEWPSATCFDTVFVHRKDAVCVFVVAQCVCVFVVAQCACVSIFGSV